MSSHLKRVSRHFSRFYFALSSYCIYFPTCVYQKSSVCVKLIWKLSQCAKTEWVRRIWKMLPAALLILYVVENSREFTYFFFLIWIWYFVTYYYLLWEKNVLVIEKNFWNSRLKAKNLQISLSQKVRTILVTKYQIQRKRFFSDGKKKLEHYILGWFKNPERDGFAFYC